MAYKYSIGQPFVYPRNDLDYSSNFLHMCFLARYEEMNVSQFWRMLDCIFIPTPTMSKTYRPRRSDWLVHQGPTGACLAAGIACLWGPSHGGANEAALDMLAEIGSVDRIPEYVPRPKIKTTRSVDGLCRVYKNYDPRARVMQKTCHEVLGKLGIKDDPLLDVAELEKIALEANISSRRNCTRILISIPASR